MKLFAGIMLFSTVLLFFLFLPGFPAMAGGSLSPTPQGISDDQVNAVASELYCPVCENLPLDVCPTQACAQWRDLIRLKLNQGWSSAQIKDYFAAQYGDRVLAEPPLRGLNWVVYLVPPAIILFGAINIYRTIRKLKNNPTAGPVIPPHDPSKDAYLARLEEEVHRREKD